MNTNTNTNTTNTPGLRAALIEARDWFESQAKAVSKGCGSSYELHDLREQRDALDEALAAPAPSASIEQEAMQMLWNDQQQEEKEHYRNVARGTELPLYAIHHPEDIDKTKRRAVPEQPAAPAKAVLADPVVQRDVAIGMLADLVHAVNTNGTGWDDWDEHFKDASFRPGPLRELLDKAIAARAAQGGA